MPYFNSYPNNSQMNPQFNMPQKHEIIHVNGRNGADMFQMAPNSNVLLLDDTAPIVWLAQTDGAGYKTLSAFDIVPHKEVPAPDFQALEDRISRLEEKLNAKSNNSNNGYNKQSQNGKGSGQSSS